MFHHTSRKTSRRDVEASETLKSLGSFKVSASVSEAATSRLGLGSEGLVHIPGYYCGGRLVLVVCGSVGWCSGAGLLVALNLLPKSEYLKLFISWW